MESSLQQSCNSVDNETDFTDIFYWSQHQKCSSSVSATKGTVWSIYIKHPLNKQNKLIEMRHLQPLCLQWPAPLNTHPACFTQPYRPRYAKVLNVNLCYPPKSTKKKKMCWQKKVIRRVFYSGGLNIKTICKIWHQLVPTKTLLSILSIIWKVSSQWPHYYFKKLQGKLTFYCLKAGKACLHMFTVSLDVVLYVFLNHKIYSKPSNICTVKCLHCYSIFFSFFFFF